MSSAAEPDQLLGRVLSNEVDVSALLGFLISIDSQPISTLLNLDQEIVDVRVEVPYTRKSRMDVVLYGVDGPIAVLELKVAADEHGDQLERYQKFAREHGARCVMVDLEGPGAAAKERWEHVDMVEVFGCFVHSSHATAREFASAITSVLKKWQDHMGETLARMEPAITPIVLRQSRNMLRDRGFESYANKTAAGQPMLTAFLAHPSGPDRAFLCVDLRCQNRSVPTRPWILRVGVHVERGEELSEDRRVAHDLAMQLAPGLTLSNFRGWLAGTAGSEIAVAVAGPNPLKAPKAHDAVARWLEAVEAAGEGTGPRYHPIFHQDGGRRLAAQFTLDPNLVSRDSLIELVASAMGFLQDVAEKSGRTRNGLESKERYRGCLLGGAVGDALGAPVEFMSRAQILRSFGPDGITRYAPAYGGIGLITDDTQMTLFTADGLLRTSVRWCIKGIASVECVTAHAYLRWLDTQGARPKNVKVPDGDPGWLIGHRELHHDRAPGNTCLSALMDMPALGEFARNNSKGCGGVMRVAPAGLFVASGASDAESSESLAGNAFELGHNLAALTHGHPAGRLSAGVLSVLICALVRGEGLRSALEIATAELEQQHDAEETLDALRLAVTLADSDAAHAEAIDEIGQGWVAEEALAIAIYSALVADSFDQGVVIAVNHDGDSDSTGAIAGNILGALYGVEAIPDAWREPLELRDVISEVATDLLEFPTWDLEGRDERRIWEKYPGF